jgi:hypothetical protein
MMDLTPYGFVVARAPASEETLEGFLKTKGFKFVDFVSDSQHFETKKTRIMASPRWFSIDVDAGGNDYMSAFMLYNWKGDLQKVKQLFSWLESLPDAVEIGPLKLKKEKGLIALWRGNLEGSSIQAQALEQDDGVSRLKCYYRHEYDVERLDIHGFPSVDDIRAVVKSGVSSLKAALERENAKVLSKLKRCEEVCRA